MTTKEIAEFHVHTGSSTSAGALRQWVETGTYVPRQIHTCDIRHFTLETPSGPLDVGPGQIVGKTVDGEWLVLHNARIKANDENKETYFE